MSKVKLTLNPYGDNFMFIDKKAEVFLSINTPTCIIERASITSGIQNAVKGKSILLENVQEDTVPDTETPEQEDAVPDTVKKDSKKGAKSASKAKGK